MVLLTRPFPLNHLQREQGFQRKNIQSVKCKNEKNNKKNEVLMVICNLKAIKLDHCRSFRFLENKIVKAGIKLHIMLCAEEK